MTPQELKNSILQLAVQGKLVEQRPEEGTGEELYQEIRAKKQRLIKAGTLKKEKPLPEITEDEIPFDLPEGWAWIRLGELVRVIGGVSYKKGDVTKSGLRILRGGNIQSMKVLTDEDDVFLPNEYRDDEKQIKIGDFLIVASTGSKTVIGKAGFVDREMPDTMIGAFLRICRPIYCETIEYLRCLFDSDFYRKHIRDLSQGTNINNVKESYITEFVIPLPPLDEQKRIVAKIEELLPLIDRYEQAWSKLEDFNKRFPVDMQKSILQMAIQGKLVSQLPEEGTGEELFQQIQTEKQALIKVGKIKKEKLLPEMADDEIPFDIPDTWKWVRFGELVNECFQGINTAADHVVFEREQGVPIIQTGDVTSGKLNIIGTKLMSEVDYSKYCEKYQPRYNDIFYCNIGTIGKPYIFTENYKMLFHWNLFIIRYNHSCVLPMYLKTYLEYCTDYFKRNTDGTAMQFVSKKKLVNILVPLPPLAEQKRIVAKLEEILPLCERLK